MPARQREVFETVRGARDAALALAQREWKAGRVVQGWQLDDAALPADKTPAGEVVSLDSFRKK